MKLGLGYPCVRSLGALLLAISWLGALLIAAYDVYFAWSYREFISSWELNPVAIWSVEHFGFLGLISFKVAGLVLAAGIVWYCRHTRRDLAHALTLFIVMVHGLLAVHYVIDSQRPTYEETIVGMR